MNPFPELTPMLKELKLSGILDSLDIRNRQAIEEKLPYTVSVYGTHLAPGRPGAYDGDGGSEFAAWTCSLKT